MTPEQIRNATFESLRESLADRLRDTYRAFVDHGPGTTFQISERSGMGLLTLRPRATDLLQLGLLDLAGHTVENGKKCGIYYAVTPATWLDWRRQNFPTEAQTQMGLNQGALTL